MKTKAIKLTVLLTILSLGVFAAGDFGLSKTAKKDKSTTHARIYPVTKDIVEIRVIKSAEDIVNLDVFNERGRKIYKTTITSGMNIRISHDISEFPEGVYIYKISEGEVTVFSAIILKTNETILKCSPESETANAYISQPGKNKVEINIVRLPGTETRIEAKNQEGTIVFLRKLTDEDEYKFTEDISGFPAGEFTYTVYAGDEQIAAKNIIKK